MRLHLLTATGAPTRVVVVTLDASGEVVRSRQRSARQSELGVRVEVAS